MIMPFCVCMYACMHVCMYAYTRLNVLLSLVSLTDQLAYIATSVRATGVKSLTAVLDVLAGKLIESPASARYPTLSFPSLVTPIVCMCMCRYLHRQPAEQRTHPEELPLPQLYAFVSSGDQARHV
jgi:hypothetical protein